MKILLLFILPSMGVTIMNNAKLWPPTMLSYSKNCSIDYNNVLSTGEFAKFDSNDVCLTYSIVFPIWNNFEMFTNVSLVELIAVIKYYDTI